MKLFSRKPRDVDPDPARFEQSKNERALRLVCSGAWTIGGISACDEKLRSVLQSHRGELEIDTNNVAAFDTAGAWLVERSARQIEDAGQSFRHIDEDPKRLSLVKVLAEHRSADGSTARNAAELGPVARFGKIMVEGFNDFLSACYLIGSSIRGAQMKAGRGGGWRLKSVINQIDQMGVRAVPVIAIMSFLIGTIIAQQGAYQLRAFGEELLTVQLVGILHFREIGVLLTSVMVAGRTGSAMTAEIGTMKMREEIDALQVMGLNPVGVLIFPRLVALIIVLPILTLLSDIAGIAGAIVVSDLYIGITPSQFMQELLNSVSAQHMMVGLIKAPFMALIIALTAAVEGLKVGGSAESLGAGTTSAVVRSIFAVILVDGLFAIFFSAIGY